MTQAQYTHSWQKQQVEYLAKRNRFKWYQSTWCTCGHPKDCKIHKIRGGFTP